jgi:aldehyde dehydrogenase (NAD+)
MLPLHKPSSSLPAFIGGSKRLLIGGQWRPAVSGKEFDAINPATGEVMARIAEGDAADIDLAVKAARKAFEGEWSRWTPHDRQRLMLRIHDLIEKNFEELALIETLDMGAPLTRTRAFKTWNSQTILFFASQTRTGATETPRNSLPGRFATMYLKAPVGVVGGILPWNGPLIGIWWTFGPTLATGCTCVLKPAEDASLTALRVGELLLEAGVPEGVINIVPGYGSTAGAALAAHPDVDRIAFTGSTETGRKVLAASANNVKRVQLELGGKSPDVVFADANLDAAVPGAAMGVYGNTGQVCIAGTRVFVQRSIEEEFIDRLRQFSRTVRVGNGLDPDVQLGPLISRNQLDRVMRYVDIGGKEGAQLAYGGSRLQGELANGYFIEPTVFTGVTNQMTIAREEIFGPVLAVMWARDFDDAMRIANATPFGLSSSIQTGSLSRAFEYIYRAEAGLLTVNLPSAGVEYQLPFGGTKESSFGPKEQGPAAMEFYSDYKTVYLKY